MLFLFCDIELHLIQTSRVFSFHARVVDLVSFLYISNFQHSCLQCSVCRSRKCLLCYLLPVIRGLNIDATCYEKIIAATYIVAYVD